MTVAYADARPRGLDIPFRPGNTLHLDLTGWPAGSLVGRTFTSTLGGVALALAVVGDIITIDASEAQTAAVENPADWLLTETTGGMSNDLLIGTWKPSTRPGTPTSLAVPVVVDDVAVNVTVVSGQASIVALAKGYQPNIDVPAGWGSRWYAARAEAGTRQVKVHIWGGSIVDGTGSSDPFTTSWAGIVETALRAAYGNGGTGYWTYAKFTTRTGTWTSEVGWGSVGHRTSSAGATLGFTGVTGTTVRIYYRNANVTGSFRYRIDGGSFTTITPPTGFGQEPGVVEVTGLSDGAHSIDIEQLSGTIVIHGVEGVRATGIVTARCAIGGRGSAEFGKIVRRRYSIGITNASTTITSTAPGMFNPAMFGKYLSSVSAGLPFNAQVTAVASATSATISANATATTTIVVDESELPPYNATVPAQMVAPFLAQGLGMPDLLIMGAGVNDMNLIGSSTFGVVDYNQFRAGLSNLLRGYYKVQAGAAYTFTPDLLIVGEHLANFGDSQGSGASVITDARTIAAGLGGVFIDNWGRGRRSFDYWNGLGYFADTVHPSDLGHAAMAAPVVDLLTAAV